MGERAPRVARCGSRSRSAFYTLNVLASVWRWHLLLEAQHVHVPRRTLFGSFLVALFFNNFLPSNIGGDVIRIRDTAPAGAVEDARDDGRAVDRGLGLMALVLVAATRRHASPSSRPAAARPASGRRGSGSAFFAGAAVGRAGGARAGRLRRGCCSR